MMNSVGDKLFNAGDSLESTHDLKRT